MIFLIVGLLIVIIGLNYLPIKDAELTYYNIDSPKWFSVSIVSWVIITFTYIIFICKIFIDGLIKND